LVNPTGIVSGGQCFVLGVAPFQFLQSRTDVNGSPFPIRLPGDAGHFVAIRIEAQTVVVRFGGNAPPEANGTGADHRRAKVSRLAIRERSGPRGVFSIMRQIRLATPGGVSRSGPNQVRGIHSIPHGAFTKDRHSALCVAARKRLIDDINKFTGCRLIAEGQGRVDGSTNGSTADANGDYGPNSGWNYPSGRHDQIEPDLAFCDLIGVNGQRACRGCHARLRGDKREEAGIVAQTEAQNVFVAMSVESHGNAVDLFAFEDRIGHVELMQSAALTHFKLSIADEQRSAASRT